jgi:hypothetical protein
MKHFRIINIAPLFTEHQAAITADLLRLHQECGVTDVAFMLPLSPEGAVPSLAKAEYLRDRFLDMRESLRAAGSPLKVGILMQSLIGHMTPTAAPFQRIVRADGSTNNRICPLDPDFKHHLRAVVQTVAATRPAFLLVDDDFRLFFGGYGCFCPLHLAAFNQETGRHDDRDSLLDVLQKTDAASRRIGDAWNAGLLNSLLALAREVRAGLDDIDPDLPCGYCGAVDGPGTVSLIAPIARVLGGKQPPVVRINNSWYLGNDAKGLLDRLYPTALQTEALRAADISEILSESDTFPHNRYCTPARAINAHLIFSLLHGTTGAKLWVTRMGAYEPASGDAYRDMLTHNRKLYQELFRLLPTVCWDEPATPLPRQPVSPWNPADYGKDRTVTWAANVCGHLGIPCRVGSGGDTSAVAMLTGPEVAFFTDAELTAFLANGLLLDGSAAEQLCQRGFSEQLGVMVDAPADHPGDFERLLAHPVNGALAGQQIALASFCGASNRRLTVLAPEVQPLSTVFRIPWYLSPDAVAVGPGLTLFENRLGGRVAVYAAALDFPGNLLAYLITLTFMNETRRAQLIGVLDWLNRTPLPAVALTDVDLYVRHGVIAPEAGGGELLALFNLNLDPLPEFRLRLAAGPPARITGLTGDGTWTERPWRADSATAVTVVAPLESMVPLLLRIHRQ